MGYSTKGTRKHNGQCGDPSSFLGKSKAGRGREVGGFDKNGGESQKRTGFRGELKRGADCALCGLASDRTEGCVWSLLVGPGNTEMLEPTGLL